MRLESRDYVLIVAEKPKAADKIATALKLSGRRVFKGVRVWEGFFNGRRVLVAPAVGHMFSLDTEEGGFPVFNYQWVPRWAVERGSRYSRRYYEVLKSLARGACEYVNACDYDIEGSVIGYLIIRNFGDLSRTKRAKFSSLTVEELSNAFRNLQPLDTEMVEAGLCRHELDWIWGINVSRALMTFYKKVFGGFRVLSAGRVQTPTLMEVLRRHVERETFVPTLKFSVSVTIDAKGSKVTLSSDFGMDLSEGEARGVATSIRKAGKLRVVDVRSEVERLRPLPPFNLPDLQYEAYRVAKISPAEVLRIAEALYLDQLISYPRTNSQKLPKTLNHRQVLRGLASMPPYRDYALELLGRTRLTPVEGFKEDPAHPAIHPTGYTPKDPLKGWTRIVYDMIVKRYLATLSDDAVLRGSTYTLKVLSYEFTLSVQELVRSGWLRIYDYRKVNSSGALNLKIGDEVPVLEVKVLKTYSRPPPRYTKSSLLEWMEKSGIGTEATRAEIIETLFRRGYLKQVASGVDITDLGIMVSLASGNLFSELSSVQLTRKVEEKLGKIIEGRFSRSGVIGEVVSMLRPRLLNVKQLLEDGLPAGELRRLAGLNTAESDSCMLCKRLGESTHEGLRLCRFHSQAYLNLIECFKDWRRKSGVGFTEFLERVVMLKSSGKYAREVAQLLLRESSGSLESLERPRPPSHDEG
ncbi:MAG: DNA topoisomerase I [Zestosphaera sp.]